MPTVLIVMLLRVRVLRDHVRKAADTFAVFSICWEMPLCRVDAVSAVTVHASRSISLLRNPWDRRSCSGAFCGML